MIGLQNYLFKQVNSSGLVPDVFFSRPDVARVDTKLSPVFLLAIMD